ncbi:MAG: hypothetical protein QNJ40_10035 [Xanthomonadales bacterium]|nr:hypothetical protein [Xanthomonadales bacterium]
MKKEFTGLAGGRRLACLAVLMLAAPIHAAQVVGQFLPSQGPVFGVAVNGQAQSLTVDGNQYPLPAELNPVAATTIQLLPGRSVVASHRTPEITDTCNGDAVQHMYHRLPAQANDPLTLIATICLDQPRAFQAIYDRPGLSPQLVAALAEVAGPTVSNQNITFAGLDITPGATGSGLFASDIESIRFSPSGTVALVKYDLPGGATDPADYRLVDLCPGRVGQPLANYADVGAGATAAVEDDGMGGYRVRFSHPSFLNGFVLLPIADCLGAPPDPEPGEQNLLVSLAGNGTGRVTSVPAAIDCPDAACQAGFPENQSVTLTAAASPGSSFVGWSGDCGGTQAMATVTLDQGRQCIAEFSRPAADLAVSCSGPASVVAGSNWVLSFTLTNNGPSDATNTQFQVVPGGDLAFDFRDSSAGCFAGFDGSVSCNAGLLAASEQATFDISLESSALARGSVTVQASGSSSVDDPVSPNDGCTLDATVQVEVDLVLDKDADPDPVAAGELLLYSLEVENLGRSAATEVVISDTLPAEVTPVQPASAGTCNIESVFPGSSVVATLVTRVGSGVTPGTRIDNTASVSSLETDLNPADNTDSKSVTVAAAPAPPAAGFVRIAREFEDGINDFSVPAQSGPFTGFFAQDADEGVFVSAGGALLKLYDSGGALPGRGGGFVNIGIAQGPTLDGLALAWAGQYNDTGATPSRLDNVVAASGECTPRELFDQRFLAGGSNNADDWLLLAEIRLRSGRLAFASSRSGSPLVAVRESSGSATTIADAATPLPGGNDRFMQAVAGLAFDGNNVVFHAGLGSGCSLTSNGCDFEGIYRSSGGSLSLIADTETPVPGGSGNFGGFFWDSGQMAVDGGNVVFLGYDDQRRYGIYLHDGSGLRVVVDGSTPIPGEMANFSYFGVVQTGDFDFPDSAPALKGSTVAFVGGDQIGSGLYLWQNGSLSTVLNRGDTINGNRIDGFRLGPESLGVDRLAFVADAADGQSAGSARSIYTIAVNTDVIFASGFEPAPP